MRVRRICRIVVPLLACGLFVSEPLHAQQSALDRDYAAAQKSLAAGDLAEAQRRFEALSRGHPDVAEIHATLGALLFQRGDFTRALRELERAKGLKPSLPNLDGLIAMTRSEMGHHTDAVAPLEQAFRTSDQLAVKRVSGLELERAYTAMGEHAKAVAIALDLQTLFPNDPEVLYHNERIFGNFAFLTVQTLVDIAPDSYWRYQAQAEAEESQGSHDAAIASYRKVLALDPQRPGIHYRIGRCLRERARDSHHPEDLSLAMAEFQQELLRDPENANAAYEIGEIQRLAGKLPEAKTSFEAALRSHPDFPEANLGLGTVLSSMNQPEAALPYLSKAAQSAPTDEAVWYRLSQVQRALGHKQEQQAALGKFLELHRAGENKLFHASVQDVSKQSVDNQPE